MKTIRLGLARAALIALGVICFGATGFADSVDMAAAKKEGKVAWYTSTPIKTAQEIANVFEKDTGIHVELFRSGGSAVLSRFMQEYSAGRIACDVLTTSDPGAAHAMALKGMFVNFKPKDFDKIPNAAKDPKHRIDMAHELNAEAKAWKTVRSAGQGVGSIHDVPGVADLAARLRAEFDSALKSFDDKRKDYDL